MPDEKQIATDSSSDAGLLTGADVDFGSFSEARTLERLGKTAEPAKEPEPEPKVVAEPAPAKDDKAQVSEPADKSEPVKPLTREEIQREIDTRLAAQPKVEAKKEEPKADPYPTLADPQFKTVEECETAQAEWMKRHTANAIKEALAADKEAAAEARKNETELEHKKRNWEEREAEAKTRHADYEEVKKLAASRPFNETALQFIVDSRVGPDLFVHYVKNPNDWNELIALPPEDIRLEMRLMERELKRTIAAIPVVKAKTVSDAPPPARTLTGKQSPADDPKEAAAAEGDVDSYSRLRLQERQRDTLGRFTN